MSASSPRAGCGERNGRYYAQISVEDFSTGEKRVRRVPLPTPEGKPVETVPPFGMTTLCARCHHPPPCTRNAQLVALVGEVFHQVGRDIARRLASDQFELILERIE